MISQKELLNRIKPAGKPIDLHISIAELFKVFPEISKLDLIYVLSHIEDMLIGKTEGIMTIPKRYFE